MAFPCGNFGNQEFKEDDKIQKFAKSKGAEFEVFAKLECDNGDSTHPLFKDLKASNGDASLGWNFSKFLVNKDGVPVQFFNSRTSPLSISDDIEGLIEGKEL